MRQIYQKKFDETISPESFHEKIQLPEIRNFLAIKK
jgi:hypothetical protein